MYQRIVTPRTQPVITPEQLAAFGRFDCVQKYVTGTSPAVYTDDYQLLLTFIEAATDEIETMADTACLVEQVLETYDYFPGTNDPRMFFNLTYQYTTNPWWYGFPTKDSIELLRRPVLVPSGSPVTDALTVTYNDVNGDLQTLDTSTYTVAYDKITLNVGCEWPVTDRRQDCIQLTYWAGYATEPAQVPARLQMAIMFLAQHFNDVRQIVTVEPTSEVGMTLCRMLSSYDSVRIPR